MSSSSSSSPDHVLVRHALASVTIAFGSDSSIESRVHARLPHLQRVLDAAAEAKVETSAASALAPALAPSTPASLASFIDHTILKAEATCAEIEQVCREAAQHRFYSVCVNGSRVRHARTFLTDTLHASHVHVAAVCGFPLGASAASVKAFETRQLIADGASEIDMVINVGALKDGALHVVYDDVCAVVSAAAEATTAHASASAPKVKVKVIIESACLTDLQIVQACLLSALAGADFVKTSTGFHATGGASTHAVRLMKLVVGNALEVKASGGVRDTATAHAMIALGATRLGTSSGVAIVQGAAGTSAVAASVAAASALKTY